MFLCNTEQLAKAVRKRDSKPSHHSSTSAASVAGSASGTLSEPRHQQQPASVKSLPQPKAVGTGAGASGVGRESQALSGVRDRKHITRTSTGATKAVSESTALARRAGKDDLYSRAAPSPSQKITSVRRPGVGRAPDVALSSGSKSPVSGRAASSTDMDMSGGEIDWSVVERIREALLADDGRPNKQAVLGHLKSLLANMLRTESEKQQLLSIAQADIQQIQSEMSERAKIAEARAAALEQERLGLLSAVKEAEEKGRASEEERLRLEAKLKILSEGSKGGKARKEDAEIRAANAEIEILKSQLQAAHDQKESATSSLASAESRLADAMAEIESLKSAQQQARPVPGDSDFVPVGGAPSPSKDAGVAAHVVTTLREKLVMAENAQRSEHRALIDLRIERRELREEVSELKSRVDALSSEGASLTEAKKLLEQRNTAMTEEMSAMRATVDRQKTRVRELQEELSKKNAVIKQNEATWKQLQGKFAYAKTGKQPTEGAAESSMSSEAATSGEVGRDEF